MLSPNRITRSAIKDNPELTLFTQPVTEKNRRRKNSKNIEIESEIPNILITQDNDQATNSEILSTQNSSKATTFEILISPDRDQSTNSEVQISNLTSLLKPTESHTQIFFPPDIRGHTVQSAIPTSPSDLICLGTKKQISNNISEIIFQKKFSTINHA